MTKNKTQIPVGGSFDLSQFARRVDHDRYLCALFAPATRRNALFALIAFNYEIARVRETVSEPMLGRIRLQWWREAVEEIYAGKRRRHEVATPLAEAIAAHNLSRRYFSRLIDARERDLDDAPFADLTAVERYAEDTAAPLLNIMLEVLDIPQGRAHDAAEHAGAAWALVGLLRAIPFHAAQRRLYLPADLLADAKLEQQEVLAQRFSEPLAHVISEVAARARERLVAARKLRRSVPRRARRGLLLATVADLYLNKLARVACDPYDPRLRINPLQKQLSLTCAAAVGRY